MRLWSLHPSYLDGKGLVALWREALLARHVLEGKTKGYKHHPQLCRFQALANPVAGINRYLSEVYSEAVKRGYNFDGAKLGPVDHRILITVSSGQIDYEKQHLLRKLKIRDVHCYQRLLKMRRIDHFSIFKVIEGEVESWEKY